MSGPAATTLRLVVLSALLVAGAAHAHHSAAVFDSDKVIELRGVVVDFKLRSPHSSFVIEARAFSKDGVEIGNGIARWEIESESVPVLRSYGIEPDTFEPGDTITITASPHRDPGFKFAHSLEIRDAFGGDYVMTNSNRLYSPSIRAAAGVTGKRDADVPARASDIARLQGRWQQPFTRFGAGPGLPLNDAGMRAWRDYDRKQSPANVCEPINVPDLFFSSFFLFEIRIDEHTATLHNEYFDVVRTIPLSGAPLSADTRGFFGHAVGRIDGDALVVESRDFQPSRWGLGVEEAHGADIPSSARKTLTERFTPAPDGRTLVYEYTLDDPEYMTGPETGRIELTRVPEDAPFYPFDCDTESAAMWSRHRGDAPLRVEPAR